MKMEMWSDWEVGLLASCITLAVVICFGCIIYSIAAIITIRNKNMVDIPQGVLVG